MNDVLTLILGGGRGARLYPLTHMRSKPAVPIGGKYRLIDIPISNCLHAGLKRMFVLTQFNSASLNRHIAQTYRLDVFSDGFVEVLAAEQTPESSDWFQGTADAVRQAARHFSGYDADNYLILAGDHLYRMDFCDLVESHIENRADITIAAQPVTVADATEMGIFMFDIDGQITAFEEKPNEARLAQMGSSTPRGSAAGGTTAEKPFVASMGIYVFSRDVLVETLNQPGIDFGKEIIPKALNKYQRASLHLPRLLGRRRDDRRVLRRQHPADAARGAVQLLPSALADLHASALPPRHAHARLPHRRVDRRRRLLPGWLRRARIGDRHPDPRAPRRENHPVGAARRRLLRRGNRRRRHPARHRPRRRARSRHRRQERPHRRRRRLVNEKGIQEADGDGYYIRNGIIIVPKGGHIAPGVCV